MPFLPAGPVRLGRTVYLNCEPPGEARVKGKLWERESVCAGAPEVRWGNSHAQRPLSPVSSHLCPPPLLTHVFIRPAGCRRWPASPPSAWQTGLCATGLWRQEAKKKNRLAKERHTPLLSPPPPLSDPCRDTILPLCWPVTSSALFSSHIRALKKLCTPAHTSPVHVSGATLPADYFKLVEV